MSLLDPLNKNPKEAQMENGSNIMYSMLFDLTIQD